MLERLSKLRKNQKWSLQETADDTVAKAPMLVMKMVIDYLHYNLYLK